MLAVRYMHIPGFSVAYIRRRSPQLFGADGPVMRSQFWLMGKAKWHEQKKQWTFEHGPGKKPSMIQFYHFDHWKDHVNFQGPPFQLVLFDELTQFEERMYDYLFSRMRMPEGMNFERTMIRSATNPGGDGHDWVKRRFITDPEDRVFVPAKIGDNPYINREEYVESFLRMKDPLIRAQLLEGDWDAVVSGEVFKREWFRLVDAAPPGVRWVRYWDFAATPKEEGTDPDYTAGALVGMVNGRYYIKDVQRFRASPDGVAARVRQTAISDGRQVVIGIEQEPGSSGVMVVDHYQRIILQGFACKGYRSTGDKRTRATPVVTAAEAGNVFVVGGEGWLNDFLAEAGSFPFGSHDDQVDAVSGAFEMLAHQPSSYRITSFNRNGRRELQDIPV